MIVSPEKVVTAFCFVYTPFDISPSAGLDFSIKFLGVQKDVERLMLGSALLLFPSQDEGLGMVAVEAQAAGLRVLASDLVPRECVVMPELVTFRSISDGDSQWAKTVLDLIN